MARRRVLHVGCGGSPLPSWIGDCDETRLDIDPACNPDVVASITDMGDIGTFDAVVCSHCLEHLYPHDVPTALSEFRRVVCDDGAVIVVVPDLEDIRPTTEAVYESPMGPICGLDMFYGKGSMLQENPYMAHHCGFVETTLRDAFTGAGFSNIHVWRAAGFNLFAIGKK